MEQWKQSLTLPTHEVSSFGRVRRTPHKVGNRTYGGKAHVGAWDKKARRFVLMYKRKTYRVSVLVCEAFNGSKPFPAAVVMHDDENSANNAAVNLKWGTQKENLNYPGFKEYAGRVCQQKLAGLTVPF